MIPLPYQGGNQFQSPPYEGGFRGIALGTNQNYYTSNILKLSDYTYYSLAKERSAGT